MCEDFMSCKWKNLLPDDTRIVELASAIAIFISVVLMFFGFGADHTQYTSVLVFSAIISFLQLLALVVLDHAEALRVYASLVMGGLMIYLGIVHSDSISVFNYVTMFTLGIANLYAFLVNNQRLVWK
jgi:hypothetical protein